MGVILLMIFLNFVVNPMMYLTNQSELEKIKEVMVKIILYHINILINFILLVIEDKFGTIYTVFNLLSTLNKNK